MQERIVEQTFHWTTDEGANITIPLRIKMRLIRQFSDLELDADGMFKMLDALIPDQADTLDDMDVNDFQNMFKAWQKAYNEKAEASLGESVRSSA